MKKLIMTTICFCVVGASTYATAQCSDSEYRIYQQYDKFLDANPSTPDTELRVIFARKIGMEPTKLRMLYARCVERWVKQNPKQSQDHFQKELDGFVKSCSKTPNDPICKSALGK